MIKATFVVFTDLHAYCASTALLPSSYYYVILTRFTLSIFFIQIFLTHFILLLSHKNLALIFSKHLGGREECDEKNNHCQYIPGKLTL